MYIQAILKKQFNRLQRGMGTNGIEKEPYLIRFLQVILLSYDNRTRKVNPLLQQCSHFHKRIVFQCL